MTKTVQVPVQELIEQAVVRFFHMLNSHCPGNVVPLLTADVELLADEKAEGAEAVNAFFIRLWEAYPCINFTVENLLVSETGAAAEVTYNGGPKGTGSRCMVFAFKGEKIRRIRCY
ncbi:MAG TPA: nuclear transport factor 2 family protein [Symbiobacteriaceae bacterium]|nr:nuclear transport factor 2 family protein [Symbiobacteriaceae bacterium]